MLLGSPSVPDQGDRHQYSTSPGVFTQAIFRVVDELAGGGDAIGTAGFASHDVVDPGTAEETREMSVRVLLDTSEREVIPHH